MGRYKRKTDRQPKTRNNRLSTKAVGLPILMEVWLALFVASMSSARRTKGWRVVGLPVFSVDHGFTTLVQRLVVYLMMTTSLVVIAVTELTAA